MIKKLKERIKFRRRRRFEKKLRKYVDKYLYSVVDNVGSLTKGELMDIRDIASRCHISMLRIYTCVDLEFLIRFEGPKIINPQTGK